MRRRMRAPGVAVAVASAALLAACGGSTDGGAAAADSRERAEDAFVKFAQCMREHGIDVPDPGEGGALRVGPGPGDSPDSEKFREAEQACRKHLRGIRPAEVSPEQREEFERQATRFAQCMREHGIDMPDPEVDGAGGGLRQRLAGGVNPNSPRFGEAEEACRKHAPRGGRMDRKGP